MNEASLPAKQAWVIPTDPMDLAPLPALLRGEEIAIFCRKQKTFGAFSGPSLTLLCSVYTDFESCRLAMIEGRTQILRDTHDHAKYLAATIEHIRTIPTASFPNVEREVRKQEGQQEEGQGQQEAQAEEVKPAAKPELKRPLRKNNA